MTRQILAVLLTVLLTDGCFGQSKLAGRPSPKEQVHAVAIDSPVEVRLADGSNLRGWISEVSDTGFVLSYEKKKQLQKSQITFDQVRAVKQVKSVKSSHTTRNILIGVGVGVVAIIAVAAIAFARNGPLLKGTGRL